MLHESHLFGELATGFRIIQHGKTGRLYKWKNVKELGERIQFLHDNPKEGVRIGGATQQ